ALLALSEMPQTETAGKALVAALADGSFDRDAGLTDGVTIAAAANDREFLKALASTPKDRLTGEAVYRVAARAAEHYAPSGPVESAGSVLASLVGSDRRVAESIIGGISQGWPRDAKASLDEGTEKALAQLLTEVSADARGQLVGLATRWGSKGLGRYAAEIT